MKATDSGLLTLSRFPIVAQDFISYPYGIFSDSIADKGVLYTAIEVTMGTHKELLHVFNTHTNASYPTNNPASMAASVEARQSQMRTAK